MGSFVVTGNVEQDNDRVRVARLVQVGDLCQARNAVGADVG